MTFVNKIYKSDQLLDLISSSMFQREQIIYDLLDCGISKD